MTKWINGTNSKKDFCLLDLLYCVVSLQGKAKIEYFKCSCRKGTSPKIVWNILRNALPSPSSSSNGSSGGTNLKCLLNSLNDYFLSISSASPFLPFPTCSYRLSTTLLLPPVNPEWCEKVLASMRCSPAMGIDNIPSYSLKVS